MKILICEDDQVCLQVNKAYIEAFSVKYSVDVEIETLYITNKTNYEISACDIAFLDIDLGGESGIEVARKILSINRAALIIFITNHTEFALDACKLQCYGYLLKPIKQDELEILFGKAVIQARSIINRKIDDSLTFFEERRQYTIRQKDIIYIERSQRKINIVTMNRTYSLNDSIQAINKKLVNYFLQINQSVIVNAKEIQSFECKSVYMKTGQMFKIGRAFNNVKERYHTLA